MLEKVLTLTDLTLFGVASIVGSGGFNLIGKAIRSGGSAWPWALLISCMLLLGASYAYADAFAAFGKNTSESDLVSSVFGPVGEGISVLSILTFNIVSISTILIFCSHMLFPNASWNLQVGFATLLLAAMSGFSLTGIDFNRDLINTVSTILIGVMCVGAGIGFYDLTSLTSLSSLPSLSSSPDFTTSLLYFFFILAGFDANMKFASEAKEPADIPRSFYTSNLLSFVLVGGLAIAIMISLPNLTEQQENDSLGHLFAKFFGKAMLIPTKFLVVTFLLTTTFVVFLSATRYLFGLGEKFKVAELTALNAAEVPYNAVAIVFGIALVALFLNNIDRLVKISDVGIITLLGSVAAAASVAAFKRADLQSGVISGLTATGMTGLLTACLA
jgi:amino acid transporter